MSPSTCEWRNIVLIHVPHPFVHVIIKYKFVVHILYDGFLYLINLILLVKKVHRSFKQFLPSNLMSFCSVFCMSSSWSILENVYIFFHYILCQNSESCLWINSCSNYCFHYIFFIYQANLGYRVSTKFWLTKQIIVL